MDHLHSRIRKLFTESIMTEEDDQFVKEIDRLKGELKDSGLVGVQMGEILKTLRASVKAWKEGNTTEALKLRNNASDLIGRKSLSAANATDSPKVDELPGSSFNDITSRPEKDMTKFGNEGPASVAQHDDRQLPAGVAMSRIAKDDIDDIPVTKSGIATSARGRTESKLMDVEKLFQNIKTNLERLSQGVGDVKRALKAVDLKDKTNNTDKFNVDYDKIKTEASDLNQEWEGLKSKELSKTEILDFNRKVKKLADKVAIYFGHNFYRIKNARPDSLHGDVWTFVHEKPAEVEKPLEAPKPIEAPKAIETPKPKNWEDELAASGYGKEDDPDAELGLSTRERHADDEDSPLRETIKDIFKL